MNTRAVNMLTSGPGHRPSRLAMPPEEWRDPLTAPPRGRVQLLAYRQEHGMNLMTGMMLRGDEAKHWLRLWAGLAQEFHPSARESVEWDPNVERLIRVERDSVSYISRSKMFVRLKRDVSYEVVKRRKRRVVKLVSVVQSPLRAA